ncbi:putative uridylyltransferase [Poriferisphaera corsica]|uniref:Putative uridylyltransferase n=1 Tax=Poriferisphaera corsica TaxID=2528020 RepID=A0A517YPW6_9BACT|nr:UDPGP type 1 family protein [Poriferisphaera corsica]QDU32263.1 putative uridylyltransferase [Poriferisphaera corsica]
MDQASRFEERFAAALSKLEAIGQAHVLTFYNSLDPSSKSRLLDQIEKIDWDEVARLRDTHVLKDPELKIAESIEPAPYYPYVPTEDLKGKYAEAKELGEKLIGEGRVAAFCVAGGQGTRLGFSGPKGMYPATPIRERSLFECFADYIRNVQKKYGCRVPFYVMTSPLNHAETVNYFKSNDYLGLDEKDVMLFPQAMMPAMDCQTGKVLMASVDSLALSPNGHGGSLKALYTSGAIQDMRERGVQQISYVQVDNPLVRLIDPLFVGLHAMDGAEMSSKMLEKRDAFERVGNFCLSDGRMSVIEYSDMPEELAVEKTDQGELKYCGGSIAIHMMSVGFVEKLNKGGFMLPFHRADKKVPYMDMESKLPVSPREPNGVKLETFVFDALPLCNVSIVYETLREDEFAPIKNADGPGVLDSPATSKQMQTNRAAKWLEQYGVKVPRDSNENVEAVIEISQLTAVCAEDLEGHPMPKEIARGAEIVI